MEFYIGDKIFTSVRDADLTLINTDRSPLFGRHIIGGKDGPISLEESDQPGHSFSGTFTLKIEESEVKKLKDFFGV